MSAAVLDRPTVMTPARDCDHGVTLEERLSAALCEAHTNGSTECPVCHSRMRSTRAGTLAGARAGLEPAAEWAAECGGCGSRLS